MAGGHTLPLEVDSSEIKIIKSAVKNQCYNYSLITGANSECHMTQLAPFSV